MIEKTHEGTLGGNIGGKLHVDGGVQAVIVDDSRRPVEIELGEAIITKKAVKKHWKTLSKINQSEGGNPIVEPKFEKGTTIQKFCPEGTKIQTLLFEKKNFTQAQAKKWATEHGFEDGIDEGITVIRMRQEDPKHFVKKKFKTIKLKDGVLAVIGCPKEVEKKLFGGNVGAEYFTENIDDSEYKWKITTEKAYSLCDTGKPLPLSKIIEHKEFFNKYPKAKKILVYFVSIKGDDDAESEIESGTSYGLSKIYIGLHLNYYKKNKHEKFKIGESQSECSKEAALLHEIQHVCQQADRNFFGRTKKEISDELSRQRSSVGLSKEDKEFAAYYKYKKQESEQEAMLCVYVWLKNKGIQYTNTFFLELDKLHKKQQEDSQEGRYEQGATIKQEIPIKVIEAYESWNDPKSTITSGQARKTLSDFAIELQAQGKIKIYSYGNAHIHALNWLDENHKAEEFSNGGILKSTNKTNKNEINDIISGVSKVTRGSAIQSAAIYLRKIKGSNNKSETPQHFKNKEASELKKYAKSKNIWIEKLDEEKFAGQGNEHDVYFYDKKHTLKANSCWFYSSWEKYLNSLILHNYFFPGTYYELIGFTEKNGCLFSVVKQPLIEDTEKADLQLVSSFLLDKGFENTENFDYYNSELGIHLQDIHDENVLTKKGVLYFIDTVFYVKDEK